MESSFACSSGVNGASLAHMCKALQGGAGRSGAAATADAQLRHAAFEDQSISAEQPSVAIVPSAAAQASFAARLVEVGRIAAMFVANP